MGGWSHSPSVGEGGDVGDRVLCVGGGYGEGFCFNWDFNDGFDWWGSDVYSFVNFFGRNVARDIG